VPVAWVLQGGLGEKSLGLPHARYRWFQPAPTDPPQHAAELLSQMVGKTGLRKGKKHCTASV